MERQYRAAKIGIARERYAGWLDVKRTISGALDSYRTECVVDFKGGWAELRQFAWSGPMESVWHTGERCYFLSLSLDCTGRTNRRNMEGASAMPDGGRRVLVVPPGQTVSSVSPASGQRRSMRCLIDANVVEAICSGPPDRRERARLAVEDFSGGPVEWLLLRMYREISAAQIGMKIAVESIAQEIAVEIARALERLRRDAGQRSGGLPPWRLQLIIDHLQGDGPLPKVGDLATLSGMTVRHLGRAFQRETGRTIGQAIAAIMAERAGRMLEAGMPVAAIAATLGYASSSSFAHAFHRETGSLPSSVRHGQRHRAHAKGREASLADIGRDMLSPQLNASDRLPLGPRAATRRPVGE